MLTPKYIFIFFSTFTNLSECFWGFQSHKYSQQASNSIKQAIKKELLDNIDHFANETSAGLLQDDLTSGNYQMVEIDILTINQIFSLLQIEDPNCDTNDDKMISGSELKCLNKIWKYYVPGEKNIETGDEE